MRFNLGDTNEKNEPGQVIHSEQHIALVGDYDLLAVIDPLAPGRNIVLAAANGEAVEDRLGPESSAWHGRSQHRAWTSQRVMHGAL